MEFPELTKYEEGALDHLLSCPSENSVQMLSGWSTFGDCTLDEETRAKKQRRCKRALTGLVRKGYAQCEGERYEATDLAYWLYDWGTAVRKRGSSTRSIQPEDLTRFVITQKDPRTYDKPSSLVVRALCYLDALDVAFYRLSRRGVHNDNFRSEVLMRYHDLRYSQPLSRELARSDLAA